MQPGSPGRIGKGERKEGKGMIDAEVTGDWAVMSGYGRGIGGGSLCKEGSRVEGGMPLESQEAKGSSDDNGMSGGERTQGGRGRTGRRNRWHQRATRTGRRRKLGYHKGRQQQ